MWTEAAPMWYFIVGLRMVALSLGPFRWQEGHVPV